MCRERATYRSPYVALHGPFALPDLLSMSKDKEDTDGIMKDPLNLIRPPS